MSNDSNIEELRRANAELNALVARLLDDTDALFNSRTWGMGYRIANWVRRLQRIVGSGAQAHMGPDHFRKLADEYYACQSRPSAVAQAAIKTVAPPAQRSAVTREATVVGSSPTQAAAAPVINGGIPEIPKNYIESDVEVVVRGLWSQISGTQTQNG